MSQPLDLRELDAALGALLDDTAGHSILEILSEAGRIVQSIWRDNIMAAGLIDTGAYSDSIAVSPDEVNIENAASRRIRVQIGGDVRNKAGKPYPVMLEYGDSEMPANPVGMRAFDSTRRRVVNQVGVAIERKVRSRRSH